MAGWGPRAGGTLIDFLIWFIVTFIVNFIVSAVAISGEAATGSSGGIVLAANLVNIVIGFIIYAAYTGFMMQRSGAGNGQTLGMQLLNIRVVRVDGQPISLGTVAIRHWLMKYIVFGFVAVITLYIATLLNYLWPLWDDENRAFHDMAAGTRVVVA